MAGSGNDLELRDALRQCADDLVGGGDRCHGVELADGHERRRVDTAQLVDDVESADELHPVRVELEILGRASLPLFIRDVWAEGGKDASPLLLGHLIATVAAPRDLSDFVACD